ncbi:DUF3105 domain-containing protein [Micromonospora sp. NPDC003197]
MTPTRPARRTGLIIGIVAGVVVLALLVCGVGGFLWYQQTKNKNTLAEVIDYRKTNPEALAQDHVALPPRYPMTPPAGGPHFSMWQNCNGDVYSAPIVDGNAVHSLEHGAVWITYLPSLPAADVERLAKRVRGQTYLMLSPYPGQESPISLQAWGYQLRVNDVDDEAIDEFIRTYRETASMEPGATCGNGVTRTR